MRYLLLLRGVNLGARHKVSMAELKTQLSQLGFSRPASYINSGNLFFDSEQSAGAVTQQLQDFFKEYYPFIQHFCLLSKEDYQEDL